MTKCLFMFLFCIQLALHHAHANTPTQQNTTQSTQNSTNQTQTDENAEDEVEKDIPKNPHDPNNPTLIEGVTPNDSELSLANIELLAKNTQLERQVDTLTTQNNVLVQERSGQLFMYGAMTAIFSMIAGFVLAKLINPKKDRW